MSGVAGKALDLKLLRRVLSYASPYKLQFTLGTLLTLLLGAIGPIRPVLIMVMVNDYIATGNQQGLLNMAIIIVGLLFAEAIVQFFQVYMASWLGQHIIYDIRSQLFRHITHFRLQYFDKTPIGTLVTRAVSDIETIAEIFSQGILTIIGDLLKLILIVAFMFWINWQFTLLVLIPIPILFVATWIFKNAIKKAFQSVRTQVSRLNTFVQEHVTGMVIVQTFNREKVEAKRFREINAEHKKAHIKSIWAYSIFFPVVEILSALSVSILIWYGLKSSGAGAFSDTSQGSILGFIMYIFMLYRPIRMLADRFNVLQMGMVGSERVFRVLDTDSRIPNKGTIAEGVIQGDINFNEVYFAYNEPEYVLHGISFEVKAGETVAFVGATGAGKSTVINILSRFYGFQKGEITIDGKSIRDYELNFLRRNIAVVLQDVFLFSDTIMNNITLGNPTINESNVIEASKAVGAHDFIMRLPGQYQFNVKERGGTLSVGQRQLISFIRAYVHNPKVLVLDEATSSIDTESEEMIQRATDKLTENRTSIVIAHRLSTIQKADKIIVLDQGTIVEMGTHDELLAQNGQYKRLFELQFS